MVGKLEFSAIIDHCDNRNRVLIFWEQREGLFEKIKLILRDYQR
jgi:hypothetical protein